MRLLIVLLIIFPRILGAQGSDECVTAQPIVLSTFGSVDVLVDNSSATNNPGDPPTTGILCPSTAFGEMVSDVWFFWNAPENGTLELNTCLGNLDTDIVVYRSNGGCGGLVEIACNGDGVLPGGEKCDSFGSILDGVGVVSGMSYLIRVGGWDDESIGSTIMTVNFQDQIVPPANLTCGYEASLGSLELTWQNYVDYDSINLYIEGNFVGELDGVSAGFQAESYGFLPPLGFSSVCIEGVLNGITSDLVCCSIYIPEPCPSSVQIVLSPYQTIPPLVNCVSCESGGIHADNSYLRSFDLKNDYGVSVGISEYLNFECVSTLAVSLPGDGNSQPIRIRFYVDLDGEDPTNFLYTNGVNVGQTPDLGISTCHLFYEEEFQVPVLYSPTRFNFVLGTGVVDPDVLGASSRTLDFGLFPPASRIVAEIYSPSGTATGSAWTMFTGSNDVDLGQSFVAALACGIPSPESIASACCPNDRYVIDLGLNIVADSDGDGILDDCDIDLTGGKDCDLNGVDDSCQVDADMDGTIDDCDSDIDGDGIGNDCDIDQTPGEDCDFNGQLDLCQSDSDSDSDGVIDVCDEDLDGDGVINSCDLDQVPGEDCDSNGILDVCDLQNSEEDCNNNLILDACEIAGGSAPDCDGNGIIDQCEYGPETDCNSNGLLDSCDILFGVSTDCNQNSTPDDCEVLDSGNDCDSNQILDECELLNGDCNQNGLLDVCEVEAGTAPDCNSNQVPDICEFSVLTDCNNNRILDECDVLIGLSEDCNSNLIPDECDLVSGDFNTNGIPDDCEENQFVRADVNGDSSIDIGDAVAVLAYLFTGGSIECEKSSDSNDDGAVNVADGIQILGYLFSGAVDPPAPFPDCGNDSTKDQLSCRSYFGC
ncbi:hypothetical protein OAU96_01615 [Planctomycetota bacterium]|nr:hypothetical protein [Planctomycetota bacterium]